MASTAWKAWERYLAALFGGKRRGAHTSDGGDTGETDVIHDFWGIEAKLYKQPHYGVILDACRQAEENSVRDGLVPVAVIKRKGDLRKDALVCFRLETFKEFFHDPIADLEADDENLGWQKTIPTSVGAAQ